jgi:hypothetical protein
MEGCQRAPDQKLILGIVFDEQDYSGIHFYFSKGRI